MSKDRHFTGIIDRLYDAAVAPESWPDVLQDLADFVGAVGCCIAIDSGTRTLIAPPVSPGVAEPLEDFVESGWYRHDLRGKRGWPLLKSGRRVLLEHDVSTEKERRHGAYHNEWLRPWDLPWWAAVGFSCGDRTCGLALLRNSSQGPFSREEGRRIGELRPHLTRVMQIASHLSSRRAEAVLDVLELVGRPAFLLGPQGSVARLNPAAEALIGSDFTLSRGVLRAVGRENNAALQRLVSAALAPPFPSTAPEERPVAIRRTGRKPLIVRALPTIGLLSDVFAHTRALLLVDDLDELPAPPADALPSMFGLTRAETRVAASLAAGNELSQAAGALGISSGTARNHLKAIFAKTETHRQRELISLIHRISASWKS
ncbi:helix-turn-helix transcriptional regulator [Ensifer sp. LCM 4579]|uniref:helix-turn-helix transcriptional regulator n=1 Tax=Ensifer sp. LCM 4579 TaxID=1848292 RepID=UPI0008DA0AAF|nr:helix-turn-helix transcriptional regulator [Ensifer sp. LCM 4579]OHV81788.1 hypothetical protein LCM4579_18500 [Ensifer sp. LCM 4579]